MGKNKEGRRKEHQIQITLKKGAGEERDLVDGRPEGTHPSKRKEGWSTWGGKEAMSYEGLEKKVRKRSNAEKAASVRNIRV